MPEVAAASNWMVVKTFPENGPSVALLGTVAGDDTILVVTRDIAKARAVQRRLMELTDQ
jgi:arginine repressor